MQRPRIPAEVTASGRADWRLFKRPATGEAALAAVAAEAFRESAQRALIRVFMAEGNGSEALRQFSRYKVTLAEELGVRPTPAIEELVKPLRD